MTTDALGPGPPQRPAKHMFVGYEEWTCVSTAYADYWRRRAEKAEALLQEAMHLHCLRDPDDELEVLRADVAAHFDQVKP